MRAHHRDVGQLVLIAGKLLQQQEGPLAGGQAPAVAHHVRVRPDDAERLWRVCLLEIPMTVSPPARGLGALR